MSESAAADSGQAGQVADHFFRQEGARLVATLTAHLGAHRLQLAEDVVQEALVRALQVWPYRGVPDTPAAWLTQTAKNLALDCLRREQRWNTKEDSIAAEHLSAALATGANAETHFHRKDVTGLRPVSLCVLQNSVVENRGWNSARSFGGHREQPLARGAGSVQPRFPVARMISLP